ncbi:carbonic anhydrase [Clostridium cylindrosporum]|uniref:Carbonic anhydrase n=1 Tax=Clostridium cylindrosporum DSM 605 TaxID=1121307 RepID=A0A0J8D5Q2_CLOCY|nr:carbonic anhydrase [Clostridium cylindrosporum]KMT21182.1 carbonic anhydrase [Clostridium cylindrosporum DSM 605]
MSKMISLGQLTNQCGNKLSRNDQSSHTTKCSLGLNEAVNKNKLTIVLSEEDIPSRFKNTPIELLLRYHNLRQTFDKYDKAKILVGMCMDNRKHLHIPDNFAYIIRSAGGNLRYSEFKVSYSISVGDVEAIVLIGHNNCGMTNLISKEQKFVNGLVQKCGWEEETAKQHFRSYLPMFEIGNEIDFVIGEAKRLREKYKSMLVVPLFYNVEDNLLYIVEED